MKPAAGRLILTVVLFLGWLGYLGYLVLCGPHTPDGVRGALIGRPLTLSRPQFLVSMLDIVAEVNDERGENVVVKEVLFPKDAPVKVGDTIRVEDIDKCRPVPDPLAKDAAPPSDFTGPGLYLLPLQVYGKGDQRRFQVVPTPPSPGFPPSRGHSAGPPRLYPASPGLLAEYREIAKGP
jgi:hypothetical protein